MVLDRNILCSDKEVEEAMNIPWFVDDYTGEAHPILFFEWDVENSWYKKITFADGYKYKDIKYLRPTNIFGIKGMETTDKEKPYKLIFSGQFVKVTNYHFTGDTSVHYSTVSYNGNIERLGYNFDIDIVTPEEYFVNTSESYRALHPDLKKKYYIGI